MKSGELRGTRVHPQQAPAKIDNALGGVGEELRFDLVETAAASGDDAGRTALRLPHGSSWGWRCFVMGMDVNRLLQYWRRSGYNAENVEADWRLKLDCRLNLDCWLHLDCYRLHANSLLPRSGGD